MATDDQDKDQDKDEKFNLEKTAIPLSHRLTLSFNLTGSVPAHHILYIPNSMLAPGFQFRINLSKVNVWPVIIQACIHPKTATSVSLAAAPLHHFLKDATFFAKQAAFNEKYFLNVPDSIPLLADQKYWLVVRVKITNSALIAGGKLSHARNLYANYGMHVELSRSFHGFSCTLIPLIAVITGTVLLYFTLLQKYHMKLFNP